jgi:NDP-sugar pyrophosphorylase family protein
VIALVYCAGFGKRLGKLTKETPKCMIKVAGKPCLERIVEKLNGLGVKRIIVNTHWLPLRIMEYFGDRILYTFEPELMGENLTLNRLVRWLEDEFVLVCNGDTLTEVDLNAMMEIAMNNNANVRHMDHEVYAGYTILCPDYFRGNRKFINYISPDYWVDIGTPKGLKEANEHYKND